jgi:hypothetical protein
MASTGLLLLWVLITKYLYGAWILIKTNGYGKNHHLKILKLFPQLKDYMAIAHFNYDEQQKAQNQAGEVILGFNSGPCTC